MSKRPVALEDLLRFEIAGESQISPDGGKIVFTVKRTDSEKNRYFTRLWMANVDSGRSRTFTADGHSDSCPRWSPDGSQIAYASNRDDEEKNQIYLIPADGGEAQALTKFEDGAIAGLAWSPDGSRIAFLFRSTPEQWRKKSKEEREEKHLSSPPRLHRKMFYRLDGFGYFDESYWQIHLVDTATGEVKQLTNEPRNFGGPYWSPDGARILFIANRRDDDDLMGERPDLWTIPADGGEPHKIDAPEGPKEAAAWSPDGRWIAYTGHTDPDDTWGGRNERVMLIPSEGSHDAKDLTGASDKAVGYLTLADNHEVGGGQGVAWSPDSRTLHFPVSEQGSTRLYSVDIEGKELKALTPPDHEVACFSLSKDGRRFGITMGNATDFYNVFVGNLDVESLEPRRLSDLNRKYLNESNFQIPEEMRIPNGDGGSVHGWILRPPDFDESRKYPAVVYVHGGPALQYGGRAAPLHEHQWLAANGYVVLFSNPRGSKGYGEGHTMAIKGDWGNKDWIDVQAIADYGASLPYVDSSRMAIMGGSYGGFMTAWAVGHSDRFRCAITDRLVGNMHSMSGTCDFPWEHGKFYKGNAWDDPSDMWRVSPLHYAGRISTPLLIIHSDGDLRCPVSQAEELFAALRWQRKEVEFVRYPPESSHGLSRSGPPDLRLDRLKRNLAWLDKHLK